MDTDPIDQLNRHPLAERPLPRDPAGFGAPLAYPPVTNGLDFLVGVIDHLATDEQGNRPGPRGLKYAVVHLEAAAEVLLKAGLEREHWSLVAEKITERRVGRAKFEQGDFAGITPAEAVRRIRDIVGFPITPDEEKALDALTKKRNALQHYGLTATYEEIEALTARVLDFLIRFLDESLFPDLSVLVADDEHLQDIGYVRDGANRLHAYVEQRLTRLAPALEGLEDRTVQCTRCFQHTVVVEVDRTTEPAVHPRCRFCHTDWHPFALAHEYDAVHNAGKFSSDSPNCPRCGTPHAVARYVFRAVDLQHPRAIGGGSHFPEYPSVTFCFECAAPVVDAVPPESATGPDPQGRE